MEAGGFSRDLAVVDSTAIRNVLTLISPDIWPGPYTSSREKLRGNQIGTAALMSKLLMAILDIIIRL